MTIEPQSGAAKKASNIKRCRQLATQLMADRISIHEYAYNMTLAIVDAPDGCMEECLALIPASAGVQYTDFLRGFLEPVDFMPCPRPFLVDTSSDQMSEQKKRQLRPKYVRLYELMKARRG